MKKTAKYIRWFSEISKSDIAIAGGKGANLGELTQAKIPVPPGFVILSSAYFDFLDANDLRPQIKNILLKCDVSDTRQLESASDKVQKLLHSAEMPEQVSQELFTSYDQLGSSLAVAVRSSATAEDLPDASFAGQQESYLNVIGDTNLLIKVRQCWESLFGARAIFYRDQKKFDHFKVGIAVPVQKMVQSEVSGVMFTTDPISQNRDRIIVEAIYGLGDYIVQGVVTPDHYEISRASGKITVKIPSTQTIMEVRKAQGVKQVPVPKKLQGLPKLTDKQILEIADIGKRIHRHYFFPQDIEWARENGKFYVVQSRPITTLKSDLSKEYSPSKPAQIHANPILKGAPASPGLVWGPVKIIDVKHLDQVKAGDIMVTDMTTPDFVPAMKRAAGIITNRGGLTSHAAIVSRELGVPCIVGTSTATTDLKNGMIITLNGSTGEIFPGSPSPSSPITSQNTQPSPYNFQLPKNFKTATKLYVNLAEPEAADRVAERNVDGVGLLRAEFMIANLGVHPKKVIAEGKQKQYVHDLAESMTKFCRAFDPRPVIYRATDFKTNEYRSLKGGEAYEPQESNPMLGFRGALRYIKNPDVFNLELEAIKRVRNTHGYKNLHLMIPFVSSVPELVDVKKLVAATGLYRSGSFKLWMMVEIPSNVILLEDFINVGLDGVSIGSNDLTMLILGTDRDNQDVAPQFDERNPAVLWALEKTVKTSLKMGITCGICGQAPSEYPDLVEKLVSWGITSISVNPDAIERTREIIYHNELKIVNKI
ncbi:phosphoenolpyruvate synthase [Candidatus Amesbacteria bacterium RIFCSPLOWO2_01_FULL_49_25]|uniref:Phosphoenolpyruvate synthase n=1 Tax=Candidatus Amesbacteria bacterium RIFCSPHIGHO2_01_FULL_48_32b TaxID=1797253 RepID=A0A1F4YFL7_9BACT|nr:MAG: phosphoenolpyruvate synthase [Candidatus Amesbacteria bacterium RIFCSPHIGHO2_01_FULL_48_32b]OGD07116.1 MAG: phosphoenolpyruvate synthase [Candidatus Amesbacteria bacterium RIFCSPLOWO2_01_FULL_49_25]